MTGLKERGKPSDSELILQQKKKKNQNHEFPNSRQGPEQLCEEFQLQSKPFSTLPVAYPLKFTERGARSSLACLGLSIPGSGSRECHRDKFHPPCSYCSSAEMQIQP